MSRIRNKNIIKNKELVGYYCDLTEEHYNELNKTFKDNKSTHEVHALLGRKFYMPLNQFRETNNKCIVGTVLMDKYNRNKYNIKGKIKLNSKKQWVKVNEQS